MIERKRYEDFIPFIKVLFVGVMVGSLLIGGVALNATALTLLLGAILVLTREKYPWQAIVVLAIGAIIVIAFPQFSLLTLDPVAAMACIGIMIIL